MSEEDTLSLEAWVPRLFEARQRAPANVRLLFDQAFVAIQLLRLPSEMAWPSTLAAASPVDWHERCWQASRAFQGETAACLMAAAQVFLALGAHVQEPVPSPKGRLDPLGKAWLTWKMTSYFSSLGEAGQRVTYSLGCESLTLLWAKVAQMQLVATLAKQRQVDMGMMGLTLPFSQVASVQVQAHEATATVVITLNFLPTAVTQGYLDDQLRHCQRQLAWWRAPRRWWQVMQHRRRLPQVKATARQQALRIVRTLLENLSDVSPAADVVRPRV